ncbi:MAG: GNAT family N-acetyltransferase [Candidatus Omnitrophota bacterium]|nr:GNAT family N-acetyltransferase [Candidatus Omnitrophota bacterium]
MRKGRPEDANHFSELIILTSPHLMPILFGSKVKKLMAELFPHRRHYYSFDRSFFVEVDGETAGMAQLHKINLRRREKIRMSLLLVKYLNWRLPMKIFNLLKSERMVSLAIGNDCYLSNVAVYPQFRSLGLGTKLLERVEEEARSIGKKRIVLHAETHNTRAISLYERLGYKIEQKTPTLRVKNRCFESFKAVKPISPQKTSVTS